MRRSTEPDAGRSRSCSATSRVRADSSRTVGHRTPTPPLLARHREILRSGVRGRRAATSRAPRATRSSWSSRAPSRRSGRRSTPARAGGRGLAGRAHPSGSGSGLHTGEVTQIGEGYVGIDINRTARIAAAGHGGQVARLGGDPRSGRRRPPAGRQLARARVVPPARLPRAGAAEPARHRRAGRTTSRPSGRSTPGRTTCRLRSQRSSAASASSRRRAACSGRPGC